MYWLFVFTLLVLGSCKSSERKNVPATGGPQRRPNLVLITIDTLRPDRLGCYGYSKNETPNLDKLARRGALFENAISQAPLTPPSHASIFTGTYPPVHKVRDTGGFILQPENTTLAEILQQQGWRTAAFIGSSVLKKSFGFAQGFTLYDDDMPKPDASGMASEYPERRAGQVIDRAIGWLGSQATNPYFLWVHLFDPHTPYDPPPEFRDRYKGAPYDGEVAYVDHELGRLLETIAKRAPENTLVAVLSDHGESLSNHGEFTHGVFLYDSTLRIVFLLAGPGVPENLRLKQQARAIDVAPTLLALLGLKSQEGMQGSSLAPALGGKEVSSDFSYSETLFSKMNMGWSELRAIRTNRWKYIRAPKPELYDLVADPGESSNVIENHPAEVQDLDAKLKTIIGSGREKVSSALVDRGTSEQLKSLGYLGGVSRRDYELTGKGIDPKDRVEVLKLLHLVMFPESPLAGPQRITLLGRALALDATNPTIYYRLGDEYAQAGRQDQAMKLYQSAISNGIQAAWLYSRIANLYVHQGSKAEAISFYEKAAQMNPSDSESLSDLGMAYLETGRSEDAERVFKWALAAGGEYAPAYNGLGLLSVRKSDLSQARLHFEKAVQLNPGLLEAQLNLGRIYKMMGANARARACFEAFLARASPAEYADIIPRVKAELAAMP
jgi:arylsulfatase A-like enzyme/Flp pilus assembly protein TadD